MRLYSIHIRRHGLDIDRDFIIVKEGLSWPAFLSAGLWALWHRMWLWAAALFIIPFVLAALVTALGADPMSQTIVGMSWSVIAGLVANDLRRVRLDQQGFVESGMAAGRSRDGALFSFMASESENSMFPGAEAMEAGQ